MVTTSPLAATVFIYNFQSGMFNLHYWRCTVEREGLLSIKSGILSFNIHMCPYALFTNIKLSQILSFLGFGTLFRKKIKQLFCIYIKSSCPLV